MPIIALGTVAAANGRAFAENLHDRNNRDAIQFDLSLPAGVRLQDGRTRFILRIRSEAAPHAIAAATAAAARLPTEIWLGFDSHPAGEAQSGGIHAIALRPSGTRYFVIALSSFDGDDPRAVFCVDGDWDHHLCFYAESFQALKAFAQFMAALGGRSPSAAARPAQPECISRFLDA